MCRSSKPYRNSYRLIQNVKKIEERKGEANKTRRKLMRNELQFYLISFIVFYCVSGVYSKERRMPIEKRENDARPALNKCQEGSRQRTPASAFGCLGKRPNRRKISIGSPRLWSWDDELFDLILINETITGNALIRRHCFRGWIFAQKIFANLQTEFQNARRAQIVLANRPKCNRG